MVPRQDGTGGKVRLGPISKRGNGYLRRLLVNGAISLIISKRARQDPWLAKLLATKPRKVAAVALANKLARIGWALMARQEDFRAIAGGGLTGSTDRRRLAQSFARVKKVMALSVNPAIEGNLSNCHGASRPRGNDQASIHGSHQGQRPFVPR